MDTGGHGGVAGIKAYLWIYGIIADRMTQVLCDRDSRTGIDEPVGAVHILAAVKLVPLLT